MNPGTIATERNRAIHEAWLNRYREMAGEILELKNQIGILLLVAALGWAAFVVTAAAWWVLR